MLRKKVEEVTLEESKALLKVAWIEVLRGISDTPEPGVICAIAKELPPLVLKSK
ncbi:hypothetical protein LEP1GSC151_3769 [Leptospira interrogans serovar Grippotyphosa str. LT2186]|uniref:Uncharacterized protein n=1 Tax=Leptospira interrogans serovar Grippotyphosa str. LT2186 TaxID=1001599 RepID=M3FWG9_LEPIR|nr:hypothetical protein LEP1GSC151_3769 [Leptospira interrogans serovar Grippotyphosa str. LT2186]